MGGGYDNSNLKEVRTYVFYERIIIRKSVKIVCYEQKENKLFQISLFLASFALLKRDIAFLRDKETSTIGFIYPYFL